MAVLIDKPLSDVSGTFSSTHKWWTSLSASSSYSYHQSNHKPVKTDQCDQYTSMSGSWFQEVQLWDRLKHLFFRFQSNLPTVSRPSWGFTGQTGLSGSRAAVRPVIRWPSGNQSCESLCRLNCVTEFRSADSQWRMCFILGSLWYDGLKAGVQTLLD